MPTIMPVSDLRNYNEVLREVGPGSPVFLTKNGRGCYAIVDMGDYDRRNAALTLVSELDRGRLSGEMGGWVDGADVRSRFGGSVADE